jgi:hypothetical protein
LFSNSRTASAGTKVNPTRSEATWLTITATAIGVKTFCATPTAAKGIGAKAARVVATEKNTAPPTSSVPSNRLSFKGFPPSRWREMFSMITTAVSTSMPTPRAKPPRVKRFKVIPQRQNTLTVNKRARGMVNPTMRDRVWLRKKAQSTT